MPSDTTLGQGKNGNITVAIFIYDHVELLDFTGPAEVFRVSDGFEVFTVSTDGKKVNVHGFVTVEPDYSIDTAPKADILVVPGGMTEPMAKNSKVLEWIQKHSAHGAHTMSVCTGANLLANAGLLDNRKATTWHGFEDELEQLVPSATVLRDVRFVDSGNILTTAGVSAGIDGALHLVSRFKGMDEAKEVVYYMEYEQWQPDSGVTE